MTSYTLIDIPNGPAGIRATLKVMARLTRKFKKNPTVRELALQILRDVGVPQFRGNGKNFRGQVEAIHAFVRDRIQYVKDVRGIETIQTPIETLRVGHGDCDDKSTLAAALLESIGHPTRFVAVAYFDNVFTHVFPQTRIGDKWVTLECTENWGLGETTPGIVGKMVEHV